MLRTNASLCKRVGGYGVPPYLALIGNCVGLHQCGYVYEGGNEFLRASVLNRVRSFTVYTVLNGVSLAFSNYDLNYFLNRFICMGHRIGAK